MIIIPEYDAFQRLSDGLDMAADGARLMAQHRPDQAAKWLKMAEVYLVCKQSVWKLAEESALKGDGR